MRPRKLVVRGFTCFREETTVDFTTLELFAITGPTGAGKTSLLDAMTLALYGKIYRVEGVRSIISLGLKDVRVHFEFSVGPAVYRVTRVGFANSRASQVALDRALGNGEWEPLAKGARDAEAKITTLLGLDFDGFTKAVLLPQNAFGRFLQGEPSDRRSILEALLGLEIYERIHKRANQIAEARRQEVGLLTQQLNREYADVTQERLEALQTAATEAAEGVAAMGRARAASAAARALAHRVTECRQRTQGLTVQAAALAEECAGLENAVLAREEQLTGLTDAMATLEQEIAEIAYDDARHLVLGSAEARAVRRNETLSRLGEIAAREDLRTIALGTLRIELETCRTSLAAARTILGEQRQALETAENEAQALESKYGTPATIALVRQTERQWDNDYRALSALDGEIAAIETRGLNLEAEMDRLRKLAADADAALTDAESAKTVTEQQAAELRDLHTHVTALGAQLSDAARAATVAAATLEEKRTQVALAERAAVEAERKAHGARETCERAETAFNDLRFKNAAYGLRTRLQVGDPCPVCEQNVTAAPALHPEHSLAEAQATFTRAQGRTRTSQEAAQRAALLLTRARTELTACDTAKADAEARVERINHEITALLPPDLAGGAEKLTALSRDADLAVEAAARRITLARAEAREAHTQLAQVEGERRGLPSVVDKRAARAGLQTRCDVATAEVVRVCGQPPGDLAQAALATIAEKLSAMATRKVMAAEAVTSADSLARDLTVEQGRLAQRVEADEAAATAATEEQNRLTGERQGIESTLEAAGIVLDGNVLEVIQSELRRLAVAKVAREQRLAKLAGLSRDVTSLQGEVATSRGRLAERRGQRDAAQTAASAAESELQSERVRLAAAVADGGWPGWDEAASAGSEEAWLVAIADETQTAHDRAVAEHTTLSTEARNLGAQLIRATECRARHAEAQREAEVAYELGQLLMANRFRSYLIEEAIRTLGEDGSRHLQELSGGRYSFHTEEAEFEIVDGWNADERRSVKTLSGGESFLAALALALGLAEGLPSLGPGEHGQQRLESLFIDEGFGSLDPDETLDIVVQALENLRTGDRIVGIVTHLPQLAERLPAQIRVVKSQVGSSVEVSTA
jgi:exonuclease SbcC